MVETRDSGGRSIEKQARIPSQITVRLALLLLLSVTVEQLYKPATNVLTCNQALAGLLYLMLQVRLVLPVAFSYYFPSISKRRITAVAKHSPPGHRRAAGLPLCQHHGSEIGASVINMSNH